MSSHKASYRKKDFELLLNKYPDKKECLDKISYQSGPNILINLSEIENKNLKSNLGYQLYNDIYFNAYAEASHNREKNFSSVWYQLNSILKLPKSSVDKILEIGPGAGLLNSILKNFDFSLETLDIDSSNKPDHIGSALKMPFEDNSFDLICAFQVLQHIPSNDFSKAIAEINRVTKRFTIISLPSNLTSLNFKLEFLSRNKFLHRLNAKLSLFKTLSLFSINARNEEKMSKTNYNFHRHYWEVGLKSHSKKSVINIIKDGGFKVREKFHNPNHSYHWFLILEKIHE